MPDPVNPAAQFMPNYGQGLVGMMQPSPMPQAGQTLGQGVGAAAQGIIDPYRALMQRFGNLRPGVQPAGTGNPNAPLLPSATPMPVGGGMAQPPAPQAMPGTSPAPGMSPQQGWPGQPSGMPLNLNSLGYGQ